MSLVTYTPTATDATGLSRSFPAAQEPDFPSSNARFATAKYNYKPMCDEILRLIRVTQNILSKTANYTVTTADHNAVILCDATSATFTVSLPAVATAGAGFRVTIRKTNTANAVNIDPNSTETFNNDYSTSNVLNAQGSYIELVCDGSTWWIVNCYDYLSSVASVGIGASDTFVNIATVSLGIGTWNCYGHASFNMGSATGLQYPVLYISQYTTNTQTDAVNNDNYVSLTTPAATYAGYASIDNWVKKFTASLPTLYLKAKYGVHTGAGTGTFGGRVSAVRVG